MIKKAYSVSMTYNISDAEKMQAERALICFDHTIKSLDTSSNYLNIMKTPFKDNHDIDSKEIIKARAAVRRFRDKAIDNFNEFKTFAFKCVNIMQLFSSDTQTIKLIKSFISSIDDLEDVVNDFVGLFDDLQSKEFVSNIVKIIETIQKNCESIKEIVNDRIISHIQSNILAKSWVDSISNDLQMKIEKKTPLIIDLFNNTQNQLNDSVKERKQVD